MKQIVFLKSGSAKQGGLEKYTRRLIAGFVNKGHAVTLLTSGKVEQEAGFEKISLCSKNKLSYLHLHSFDKAAKEWVKKNNPDIVFGLDRNSYQTHYRAGNGVHAAYLSRRTLDEGFFKSLSFRINPLHKAILSMEKKTYEGDHLRKIFTNSEMVKQEILAFYRTDPKKIEVVHNGIDLLETETIFKEIPFKKNSTHQLLFIGHGWQRKGLSHLLLALAQIKNESFHLTVIGKDPHPKYYESLADSLGLRKKVSFLGSKPSSLPFLQQADTLVVPSTYDPFANVTLEALSLGVFVVTSPFNGGNEILNKENGIILQDLYDPLSFAKSLKAALNRPKTLESATLIRASIQPYALENQIDKIIQGTLLDAS